MDLRQNAFMTRLWKPLLEGPLADRAARAVQDIAEARYELRKR